jgi:hypothetical protein
MPSFYELHQQVQNDRTQKQACWQFAYTACRQSESQKYTVHVSLTAWLGVVDKHPPVYLFLLH